MDKPVHFRRCHVCDHITMQDRPILKCSGCHKPLAPFYYFDDRFTHILTDFNLRPQRLDGEYSPIQGLTAYWETF